MTILPPKALLPKTVKVYVLLVSIFVAVLLLTNVITTKYFQLGPVVLTAGGLTYPFTFTLLDIITELYGRSKAQLAVWLGFVASAYMLLLVHIACCMPIHKASPVSQAALIQAMHFTPGIVVGSMVAYLVAQLTDVTLFAWLNRLTGGKHLWLRNNVSTLISQWVDTLLFGLLVWVVWPYLSWEKTMEPLPWAVWYQIMYNEYAFKVIFTVLNTPLVYMGVYCIRRL